MFIYLPFGALWVLYWLTQNIYVSAFILRAHNQRSSLFLLKSTRELNEEQTRAVTAPVQNVCVHAGPGSGKTRVLVHRVAHLLQEERIPAREILAVTFTRKAATEMKERIGNLVDASILKKLTVCTLHSFCCMVLRMNDANSELRGGEGLEQRANIDTNFLLNNINTTFSIYDSDDSKRIIKNIIVSEGGNLEEFPPGKVLECFSALKREKLVERLQGPPLDNGGLNNPVNHVVAIARARGLDLDSDLLAFSVRMLDLYQGFLRYANARDFDDLIVDTLALLRTSGHVAVRLKNKFRHVLVDEWQDIDKIQYELLTQLVASDNPQILSMKGNLNANKSLFVVGDPNQTIYSWRGANAENMENFKLAFPSCLTFRLERNYRSTAGIVAAAQGIIASCEAKAQPKAQAQAKSQEHHQNLEAKGFNSTDGITDTTTANELNQISRDDVQVVKAFKDESQAEYVAQMVKYLQEESTSRSPMAPLPSIAILYRRHNLSPDIEQALILRGVRYQMWGGPGLLGRKIVKDLLSYLRLLSNPWDIEALRRTINFPPRGVGISTQEAFFDFARSEKNEPVLNLLLELGEADLSAGKSESKDSSKKKKKTKKKTKTKETSLTSSVADSDSASRSELDPNMFSLDSTAVEMSLIDSPRIELTSRQLKALSKAGTVFSTLRRLVEDWTGTLEDLLKTILDVSGLLELANKDNSKSEEDALLGLVKLARVFEKEKSSLLVEALDLESRAGDDDDQGKETTVPAKAMIERFLDMLQLSEKELEEVPSIEIADIAEEHTTTTTKNPNESLSKVKLMTLHAAKGLEFDVVIIVGLEEGNLPLSYRASRQQEVGAFVDDSDSELEGADPNSAADMDIKDEILLRRFIDEERRLLYVGMTRAKKKLMLMYRGRHSLKKRGGGSMPLQPSRFLKNLPLSVQFRKAT